MKAITFIDSIYVGKLHLNFRNYFHSNIHLTNIYFLEIIGERLFYRNQTTKWIYFIQELLNHHSHIQM